MESVAFIPGVSVCPDGEKEAFLQIITAKKSYNAVFPYGELRAEGNPPIIRLGECVFSARGAAVDLKTDGLICTGRINYGALTPLKYDIMGPFALLPLMQCRHGVISMRHELRGGVRLNGEYFDFDGGVGYIEKDSGRAFPEKYLWVQCGDFGGKDLSVMLSVAKIPFSPFSFTGCIAAVICRDREYRFATYLGARVARWDRTGAEISQGRFRLKVSLECSPYGAFPLRAPGAKGMDRVIRECPLAKASFELTKSGVTLLKVGSGAAAFEYVE